MEVCRNDAWGTVCDDSWTDVDASVACRQLGYSRFSAWLPPIDFWEGCIYNAEQTK